MGYCISCECGISECGGWETTGLLDVQTQSHEGSVNDYNLFISIGHTSYTS